MIDNLTEAIAHAKEERGKIDKTLKYWESINAPLSEQVKYEIGLCKDKLTQCEHTIAWLTELQERREADRWIPVSERLPEDYTKVLITNEYGIVTCITWNTWYQNEYENAKKEYKAIAWKPLPKPYESEAESLDNQRAVEDTEYCERHEPTYNPDDGSM